jgi:hypothetical protein
MAIEKVDTGEKKDEKKLSHDEASHYLVLADGTHVPYQVSSLDEIFPVEHDGVRVDRVVAAH